MVPRRVRGAERGARMLQWSSEILFEVLRQHEPDHPLLVEAYAAIWLADYTPPPSGSFEQIFCGRRFACAMDAEGALQCWGQEPGRVPPEGVFVTASLGGDFGCALTQEGSAVCWGSDTGGDIHPP